MNQMLATSVLFVTLSTLLIAGMPEKVDNFSLTDYTGKKISLSDFKNSKAIVLMFVATQCPVSNAYNERYNKLFEDYSAKNVAFVGINSNKQESVEEIKQHAAEHGFKFPIVKDINNIIADKLDAQRTPEIFVVHPTTFDILYHGRIDDSQRESLIKTNDLRIALDEILAGKPVTVKETKAFGCTIKRVK